MFDPKLHGEQVGDRFNLQRIENLEREVAQWRAAVAAQNELITEQAALIKTLREQILEYALNNQES